MIFFAFLHVFVLACSAASMEDLPSWHMKPLGSHRTPETVDETFADDLISPYDFAHKYVLPRKPIVFRNVVKDWPAFKLWTDQYLSEKYGDMELRLEGKKEKKSGIPKGDVCLGRDYMETFLKDYRQGADKYVVSELPTPMWPEVLLPGCVSCGEFLSSFVEIDLWMNSDLGKKGNGGNSILHKDAFNTINCVVSGRKEWKLIELQYNDLVYQSWEGEMDRGYGGFSLVNPDKVDAKRFPLVGDIPRWQFITVNEGDCIHLPSQMWHQVKSFGEVNRAIAFLFSQFIERTELNMTGCEKKNQTPIPLSEVDVDLQYPGTGSMYMGHNELYTVMEELRENLVDEKKGYVTKRRVYSLIRMYHQMSAPNKDERVKKAKAMYAHFLALAGGTKENMNQSFVDNLTREQVRPCYLWAFPMEPANSYEHEYSYFLPETLTEILEEAIEYNGGKITKDAFLELYQQNGGTEKFAQEFWQNLAGDSSEVSDFSETIEKAVAKYHYYRREDPERKEDNDEAVIVTPQGHTSQPKRETGGYDKSDEKEKEREINKDEL